MPDLLAARAQMGISLAFHIIFSVLGVGLPLLLCIAEGLSLKTGNTTWMLLSRRWARAAAILFAIGAVSGTILSFELGLLWPTYTRYAGAVVGLPFLLEGFAFFTEAIFLGLYLYGWDRLSPRAHWLCSFPIWISGLASAWFIVSANSWMNTPVGFVFDKATGQVSGIDPIQAMLNPATPYETLHMMLACYVTTGFAVAAVYAWALLHGKRGEYYRKGLVLGMAMGLIATPLQMLSGDLNARFDSEYQPIKFASLEALYQTKSNAPLTIGGWADSDTQRVYFAIEIPGGLSLLLGSNGPVKGLAEYPRDQWPDVPFVHLSFDGMVFSGSFALLVAVVFWLLYWRKQWVVPTNRLVLWGVVLSGPLTFVALELGWMVTELGRQPWVIYNILLTKNAVTTAPWLNVSFLAFSLIYLWLSAALIWLLVRVARSPLPQLPSRMQAVERAGA